MIRNLLSDFHFLRPFWLLAIIPLIVFALMLWRQTPRLLAWGEICDPHLLDHLVQSKGQGNRIFSLTSLLLSLLLMSVSAAGPSWYQYPVATYKAIQPRVLVLDMSEQMMVNDLTPDRLSRAKFKLRDLFSNKNIGQFGLVVYTGEPFVVSPLTEDGETISSLLSTLTPDIMPVTGQNVASALNEATQLIKKAGYEHGQILLLTANVPTSEAIGKAKKLAAAGIYSSIMPIKTGKNLNPEYENFAKAGRGLLLDYSSDSSDLQQWLRFTNTNEEYSLSTEEDVPLWRDEGRWFLIPALFLLLPVFRRGWLQRVVV